VTIFAVILPIVLITAAIAWRRKRRHWKDALRCWNCGTNLYGIRLHGDAKGRLRCPKCGDDLDELPLKIRKS
jgi:hypothetical protein